MSCKLSTYNEIVNFLPLTKTMQKVNNFNQNLYLIIFLYKIEVK